MGWVKSEIAGSEELFCCWVVEELTIGFVIVADDNYFDVLRSECVSLCGFVNFDIGSGEERE